jgi:AcrR family transcriptional regulator
MTEQQNPSTRRRARLTAKGEAAMARLKQAAVTLLADRSYHQLRIADLTAEAGMATGLFYHYFSDLKSLVDSVLDEFIGRFEAVEEIERGVSKGDWFGRILTHYQLVVQTYAQSPGVMRCVREISAQDPSFRARWQDSYHKQLRWLIDLIPYVFPNSQLNRDEAVVLVYALGGIGDNVLYSRYIDRDPRFLALSLKEEELSEWLAVVFYRGLFASNPPAKALAHAERVLSLKRLPA